MAIFQSPKIGGTYHLNQFADFCKTAITPLATHALQRGQTTYNRRQTTGNRRQTTDNRRQTTDNRRQTTDDQQKYKEICASYLLFIQVLLSCSLTLCSFGSKPKQCFDTHMQLFNSMQHASQKVIKVLLSERFFLKKKTCLNG